MAEKKFGKLTKADEILFAAVANGNKADYMEGGDKDNPENAYKWGKKRIIDANRIEWLCRDKKAKELVTDKGIQVIGAKIVGTIDLSFVDIPFPLLFQKCVFNETINAQYSKIKFLYLKGSRTGSIKADGVKIENGVFLKDGFKANGEVSFTGAEIDGNFECQNGEFINKGGRAILADGTDVKGRVFLRDGFRANGEVRFPEAVIGGGFDCDKGEFINKSGAAIMADGIYVKGRVGLGNGFKAEGEVRFLAATIDGQLDCENGEFVNEGGRAISADGMDVEGSVFLRNGFKANGEVRFTRAVISGDFDCKSSKFINQGGRAISADGIYVKGNVYLRNGFKAEGGTYFVGAGIGGSFDCDRGEFINKGGTAISADRMNIKGSVFLRDDFRANGEVRFLGAAIGGDFDCTNGEFINEDGRAISADGMDVKCNVLLRNGFNAKERVVFIGATIGGHFFWSYVNHPEKTILDLRNVNAKVLWDDEESWPDEGNLFLDGFVYEDIGDDAPKVAKSRIEWLQGQYDPNKESPQFRPQPYEQLAAVLQKSGHENDAKQVLITKNKDRVKYGAKLTFGEFLWYRIFGPIIDYGYKPLKALWWMGAIIVIGYVFFGIGYITRVIVPVGKDAYVSGKRRQLRKGYPRFGIIGDLIYSLDMFVPVIDLRMAKYWMPDANKRWGAIVRWYMWFHIAAGWILTTLLIVGLTGLIK